MTTGIAEVEAPGKERLVQTFRYICRVESVRNDLHLTDKQKEQLDAMPSGRSEPAWQKCYLRLEEILLPKQLDRPAK